MSSIKINNLRIEFPIIGSSKSFRREVLLTPIQKFLKRWKGDEGEEKLIKKDTSVAKDDTRELMTGGTLSDAKGSEHLSIIAVNDVTFTVNQGDRIGLIGPNGSGKTTLLRAMSGVYEPISGSVEVEGKISALFTTTLGMDPDDTGYNNIFHMGMYLGMSKEEILDKVKEIVSYTDLGIFIDLPVKTYSAGMVARLSFAVATSIVPEILLLDEGLGAGDARFQKKVSDRVDGLVSRSGVLVIASHSAEMIKQMCNKAALLNNGKLLFFGDVEDAFKEYDKLSGTGT